MQPLSGYRFFGLVQTYGLNRLRKNPTRVPKGRLKLAQDYVP
jgi:hypothetical protein